MNETKTCATCEHWRPRGNRIGFTHLWRGDEADRKYGQCTLIDLGQEYEDAPDPLPLAVTKDGSDYRADLYTQAEFGCVLWEPDSEPGKWQRIDAEEKAAYEARLAASRAKWRDEHPLTTDPDGTTRSRP